MSETSVMATQESKEVPWLHKEIRQRLKPRVRSLFEEYVGLPSDQVESHIFAIRALLRPASAISAEMRLICPSQRDKAFIKFPFPCVGQFGFLHLIVSGFPWYDGVLAKLKAGGTILDVGCGLGQDLRFLAFDGVPIAAMRATDHTGGLWELGLELFKDKERFEGKFIAQDLLNVTETPQSSFLSQAHDVILANQIFHLFDWETQVKLGQNLVKLSKPDTWITGYQVGIDNAGFYPNWVRGDIGSGVLGSYSYFIHNDESWDRLWQEIGAATGTKWQTESRLVEFESWGFEDEDANWMAGAKGHEFCCRRVDQGAEV